MYFKSKQTCFPSASPLNVSGKGPLQLGGNWRGKSNAVRAVNPSHPPLPECYQQLNKLVGEKLDKQVLSPNHLGGKVCGCSY